MRTSILTRSTLAIASLAIGSIALAAAPSNAAAPSGVTRDLVLTVAEHARTISGDGPDTDTLSTRVCGVRDGEELENAYARPVYSPDGVDGVLVSAYYFTQGADSYRYCTFAAFAAASPYVTLSGTATLTGVPVGDNLRPADSTITTATLSGDVTVTAAVDTSEYYDISATAAGDVIRTTTSTTTHSRTITPKTTQQKKAAKKARDSTVSAAKKVYDKTIKKAGSSASKKASARRAYTAKKKAANATFRAARAGILSVGSTTTSTTASSPFSVSIYGGCGRNARC
jgi:hypothetical protein